MPEVAVKGKVVLLHYSMMDADGRPISSTLGKDPLAFRVGDGQLVLGLEESLVGLQARAGERLRVRVPASRAYGPRTGNGPRAIKRRDLPKEIPLREGVWIETRGPDGAPVKEWIVKVQGSRVWLDTDHPLAGMDLLFDVEVMDVREPLPEELPSHGGPPWLRAG